MADDAPKFITLSEAKRRERAKKSIRRSVAEARLAAGGGGGSGSGGADGGSGGVAGPDKKPLEVLRADLPATARAVRDPLAERSDIFERDGPVRIVPGPAGWFDAVGDVPIIRPLTMHDVVTIVHEDAQPWR